MAPPSSGPQKQWVLDDGSGSNPIGQVNYERYAHAPVAMPGPVLSAKTGKQYTPQLSDLGKKKSNPRQKAPQGIKRQASSGAGRGGGNGSGGLELFIQS